MLTQNDVIKRNGREIILLKKGKRPRYYKAEYDNSMMRILNKYPITKNQYNNIKRLWEHSSLKNNTKVI